MDQIPCQGKIQTIPCPAEIHASGPRCCRGQDMLTKWFWAFWCFSVLHALGNCMNLQQSENQPLENGNLLSNLHVLDYMLNCLGCTCFSHLLALSTEKDIPTGFPKHVKIAIIKTTNGVKTLVGISPSISLRRLALHQFRRKIMMGPGMEFRN